MHPRFPPAVPGDHGPISRRAPAVLPPVLRGVLLLLLSLAAVSAATAQVEITDAISREFSVLNQTLMDPPLRDAVSREFTAYSAQPPPAVADAVSREFAAWRSEPPAQQLDAVSREFTALREMTLPTIVDAVSRELTVYNDTLDVSVTDAVSREFTAFRPGPPAPIRDAHSREVAVWNLTFASTPLPQSVPRQFTLRPPRPNPLLRTTSLAFGLPKETVVTLKVYDVTGRLVSLPLDAAKLAAGWHAVSMDGSSWGSGVYFYRFVAGPHRRTGKLVIRK